MLKFILAFMLGIVTLLLFCANTVGWCTVLYSFILLKLVTPFRRIRAFISKILILIARIWIEGNSFIFQKTHRVVWDVQGVANLLKNKSYLVVSNHRSWSDIFILQHVFKREIPFLKFFLKQELIWVPLLGIAWWALDFPFLKRYSRAYLQKHPERRGKDMEVTRKFCEKFKNLPISIVNFMEGTRFTKSKHRKQKAPYRHLLSPKAGGIGLVFSHMGEYLSNIIDVTIVYPENRSRVSFWQLLTGRIPRITVRVRVLPIPDNMVGKNYEEDMVFRQRVQQWVNRLWQEKDGQIEAILGKEPLPTGSAA